MDYHPQILRTAPRTFRAQLELSARRDGHRQHSMLSLAVELEVYPHRVLDAVELFQASIAVHEGADADTLERAAFTGRRSGGSFELPTGHPAGDGHAGDCYLSDDAVVFVCESIRPPSFVAQCPVPPHREHAMP